MSKLSCCFLALMTLAFVGCSNGELPTYRVSGKVVFPDGFTAHVGTVEMKSREHLVQSRGAIQPDGTFTLTTYNEGDGAVEGTHDVVIVQFVMAEEVSGHRPSTLGVVHPKYASYSTSDLQADVSADGPNEIILTVDGVKKGASQDPDQPHGHDK